MATGLSDDHVKELLKKFNGPEFLPTHASALVQWVRAALKKQINLGNRKEWKDIVDMVNAKLRALGPDGTRDVFTTDGKKIARTARYQGTNLKDWFFPISRPPPRQPPPPAPPAAVEAQEEEEEEKDVGDEEPPPRQPPPLAAQAAVEEEEEGDVENQEHVEDQDMEDVEDQEVEDDQEEVEVKWAAVVVDEDEELGGGVAEQTMGGAANEHHLHERGGLHAVDAVGPLVEQSGQQPMDGTVMLSEFRRLLEEVSLKQLQEVRDMKNDMKNELRVLINKVSDLENKLVLNERVLEKERVLENERVHGSSARSSGVKRLGGDIDERSNYGA
eukprot:CAMPEP_0203988490 /NCGR_PEP_ID=MMETSP0360-20130528/7436_1 /ASSEMBLY_ACC=CAM_ASM_000342 /TAXON_ID=268821 /ORGANISM="Scrippsiella Hangoei, Strain SHTV-5" /LENGTH=329 /DNA_ID=CAMNT_0050928243 /DNA_START=38 /DNA_END=1024 /DNA_ORIENTATION=+